MHGNQVSASQVRSSSSLPIMMVFQNMTGDPCNWSCKWGVPLTRLDHEEGSGAQCWEETICRASSGEQVSHVLMAASHCQAAEVLLRAEDHMCVCSFLASQLPRQWETSRFTATCGDQERQERNMKGFSVGDNIMLLWIKLSVFVVGKEVTKQLVWFRYQDSTVCTTSVSHYILFLDRIILIQNENFKIYA